MGDYDNDGDLDLYIGNESTEAFKAPCQLFRNNGDGTFSDVAADAGVQNYGFTKSAIWGDYDADRFPDLYVSNFRGPNRLYRNNGAGTFTDVAEELNIDLPLRSFPAWFWDFDNDGVLDLYVSAYSAGISHLAAHALGILIGTPSSGTGVAPQTTYHNRSDLSKDGLAHLYHSDGQGGFEEVAQQYNLVQPNAPMGSNFGDLDNDGYLDFYLGTGYPDYKNLMPSLMYRNRQGISFVDVTYAGGFGHLQKGHAVVFADVDNDGNSDLYLTNYGENILYRNNGDGTFTDVTAHARVGGGDRWSSSCAFVDYDHDGNLDLYVVNYLNYDITKDQAWYDSRGRRIYSNPQVYAGVSDTLYRNSGDGKFTDVTRRSGVYNDDGKGLGVTCGDYDNDGRIDIYVANDTTPNFLYRNIGDGRFVDIGPFAGAAYNEHGVAEGGMGVDFGDYNNDGDTDIFVVNLNQEGVLLRNEGGNRQNWLMIKAVGVKSNRDGIGARVEVVTRSHSQMKEVQAGSSYLSGHDLRLIFGLGTETEAATVKITWPNGVEQTLMDVEANRLLVITEED